MKQMKKLLALLLALMMVLALAACGSEQEEILDDPQPVEQPEDQATEKAFEAGTVGGSTYTSETLGITFTVDENWTFLNDEEIGELTGMVQGMSDGETAQTTMEEGTAIYDVYAMVNDGTGRSINIRVHDTDALSGKLTTEEVFATEMAEKLKPELESVGAENVEIETTTCTLAGTQHSGVRVNAEVQGMKLCISTTCVKVGELLYVVNCTAQSEEDLTAVMELFRAL